MNPEIEKLRLEIDEIDKFILEKVLERKRIVEKIFAIKKRENINIFDPEREKEIIATLKREFTDLEEDFIERLLLEILNDSKRAASK